MKEKCKRPMKRFLSLMLIAAMFVAMPESLVKAETAEQQTTEREMPKNPVHHCTKENDGTDTTDWSYVYFGSYPQTKVTVIVILNGNVSNGEYCKMTVLRCLLWRAKNYIVKGIMKEMNLLHGKTVFYEAG